MREDIEKIIKEDLPKSVYGKALKVWFDEELAELNNIADLRGDIVEKGRIIEGRQHAIRIIKKLMKIMNINKIENPQKGNQYI